MNSNRKQSILLKWESYIFIFQVGREAGYGKNKNKNPWVGRHRAEGSVRTEQAPRRSISKQPNEEREIFQVFKEEQSCSTFSLAALPNLLGIVPSLFSSHPSKHHGRALPQLILR